MASKLGKRDIISPLALSSNWGTTMLMAEPSALERAAQGMFDLGGGGGADLPAPLPLPGPLGTGFTMGQADQDGPPWTLVAAGVGALLVGGLIAWKLRKRR